jgi:hypothetical protein
MHQRAGEVIEGPLAVTAAIALASGAVVVIVPGTDLVILTPRTLQRPLFPVQAMDIGVAGVDIEELVQIREHRHG